jgi:hypothetical protein
MSAIAQVSWCCGVPRCVPAPLHTLDQPSGYVATRAAAAAAGELVLWGATLWDPRVPAPLHTFDQLSAGGAGGCFHPGGVEIILNSEVWDLRTRKLLRSVPLLDGTSVTFNSSE